MDSGRRARIQKRNWKSLTRGGAYLFTKQLPPTPNAVVKAQQNKAIKNFAVRPETHVVNPVLSSVALTAVTTGAFTTCELDPATPLCLVAPVQGDDIVNRQGRKILIKSVFLRGYISVAAQADQTAQDTAGIARVILYIDKNTNAAQLASTNVMTNGGVNAFQAPGSYGRVRILKDKLIPLRLPMASFDGTNIEQGGYHIPWKIKHTFKKPLVCNFNATNGGTVADIIDNSLHVIGCTSSATLAPDIRYVGRVSFIDA